MKKKWRKRKINKPAFIDVPVMVPDDLNQKKFYIQLNPEHISCIVERYDGNARFLLSGGIVYETVISYQAFLRYLRIAGCKFQTLGDLSLIGEPGEEGVK